MGYCGHLTCCLLANASLEEAPPHGSASFVECMSGASSFPFTFRQNYFPTASSFQLRNFPGFPTTGSPPIYWSLGVQSTLERFPALRDTFDIASPPTATPLCYTQASIWGSQTSVNVLKAPGFIVPSGAQEMRLCIPKGCIICKVLQKWFLGWARSHNVRLFFFFGRVVESIQFEVTVGHPAATLDSWQWIICRPTYAKLPHF